MPVSVQCFLRACPFDEAVVAITCAYRRRQRSLEKSCNLCHTHWKSPDLASDNLTSTFRGQRISSQDYDFPNVHFNEATGERLGPDPYRCSLFLTGFCSTSQAQNQRYNSTARIVCLAFKMCAPVQTCCFSFRVSRSV